VLIFCLSWSARELLYLTTLLFFSDLSPLAFVEYY
jgi:hypothetical protein